MDCIASRAVPTLSISWTKTMDYQRASIWNWNWVVKAGIRCSCECAAPSHAEIVKLNATLAALYHLSQPHRQTRRPRIQGAAPDTIAITVWIAIASPSLKCHNKLTSSQFKKKTIHHLTDDIIFLLNWYTYSLVSFLRQFSTFQRDKSCSSIYKYLQ